MTTIATLLQPYHSDFCAATLPMTFLNLFTASSSVFFGAIFFFCFLVSIFLLSPNRSECLIPSYFVSSITPTPNNRHKEG